MEKNVYLNFFVGLPTNFPKNCMKLKEFGPPGGVQNFTMYIRHWLVPPFFWGWRPPVWEILDPPLDLVANPSISPTM